MKRTSSGLNVGLWVVGGLVGLYLLGGVFLYVDYRRGFPFFYRLSPNVQNVLNSAYSPLFAPLIAAFPKLFPPIP